MVLRPVCILFFIAMTLTGQGLSEYILGPQDVLYISVLPVFEPILPMGSHEGVETEYPVGGRVIIDSDGTINLHLVGRIKVTGMTTSMLEEELQSRLSEYIIEPEVIVSVEKVANARYIICGEVRQPGVYVLNRDISILEAIVSSGGFLRTALKYDVKVIRGGLKNPELVSCNLDEVMTEGNLQDNIMIQPGDIIFVPKTMLTRLNEVLQNVTPAMSMIIRSGNVYDTFQR